MKSFAKRLLGAAAIAAVLVPAIADARQHHHRQEGLCGNYQQVSSNAGFCATCTLQIADNPESQKYFVESSNGWSAETTWVEGDSSVAEGSGKWKRSVGGAYGGKRFDLQLTQQGRTLDMVMTMRGRGFGGSVEAKYRCTDY